MISTRSVIKAILPLLAIVLLLAGIGLLRAESPLAGAVCITLAMIGLIIGLRLITNSPFTSEEIEALRPWVIQAILWVAVITLSFIAVVNVADNFYSDESNRHAAIAWVASVSLGLLIITLSKHSPANPPDTDESLLEKIKRNRIELIALALILLLAFAMRAVDLPNHPYPWSGDEASIGNEAMRILKGEITNFFQTGWSAQPNWSFVPTAITELIFGRNIIAVRATSVIAGTLAVLFTYLAARELFNPMIGLMAGAFLATLPYNLQFSRIGVNNVIDSLMSSLVFWLLAKAWKKGDPRLYYVAGALAGLCIYTYAGTRLVLILAVLFLLYFIVKQRCYLRTHWQHLIAFSIAVLISVAPQAVFFARNPQIFLGRFGAEGIFLNGWLAQHSLETGKSAIEILFEQFTKTTLVFIASPAPGNFFASPQPYLTIIGSVLFLFGMAHALSSPLEMRHFIPLIWFWSVVFLGGVLTLNPPANTRLVMTSPPVSIFMALGTYKLCEYLQKFKVIPAKAVVPVLLAVVSLISFQNIRYYMFEYRENMYFQDAGGEFAMEAGFLADKAGADYHVYVLGAPRIFSDSPTISFIAPQNPRSDLTAESIESLKAMPRQKAIFIVIPENQLLLDEVARIYPGGKAGSIYRIPQPQELLLAYYIVS